MGNRLRDILSNPEAERTAILIESLLNGGNSEELLDGLIGPSHCDYCGSEATATVYDDSGDYRNFCSDHYSKMSKNSE